MRLFNRRGVFIVGLVAFVFLGILIGNALRGSKPNSSVSSSSSPSAAPSSSGSAATSPNLDFKGPIAIPASTQIGSDTPLSKSTETEWAQAALRAEKWRLYALAAGQASIEQALINSPRADTEYGQYFSEANGFPVGIQGTPTYAGILITRLQDTDLQSLQGAGMDSSVVDKYAIILVEQGPLIISPPGVAPDLLIPKGTQRELILVGSPVKTAIYGEVWKSSYILGCTAADSVSVETCTG